MKLPYIKEDYLKENEIGIFALGGLGEVGKNMYCYEYKDQIFIVDCGILFPDERLLGVDYVINDISYLKKNEKRINSLIITHGHEDHIGGIPYLLKQINVKKIYANGLAIGLIRKKLTEHPNVKANIIEFSENKRLELGPISIDFYITNHSIPDSFGLIINTDEGKILHTGDFKVDLTPVSEACEYHKITTAQQNGGFLAMLSDSTNSENDEFSTSESTVSTTLKKLLKKATGRVILATFASNVHRVNQIVNACVQHNKKIAVFGRSMVNNIEVGKELGYIKAPKGTFLQGNEMKNVKGKDLAIICTGSQGEPLAALSRIANKTHRQISLVPGDTVIFSSSPIPGNQYSVNKITNELQKLGANVIINSSNANTHASGHASSTEQKIMLNLCKPKYFIPMHGDYRMLVTHKNTAVATGVKKENSFVMDNGTVLVVSKEGARIAGRVPAGNVYIDGNGIGDTDHKTIRDRKLLSDDGLISFVISINKDKTKQLARPTIVSRGFIYMKENVKLTNDLVNRTNRIINDYIKRTKKYNEYQLKQEIVEKISQIVVAKTQRNPMIIPVFMKLDV